MNTEQPVQPHSVASNDIGKTRRIVGLVLMFGPAALSGVLFVLIALLGNTPLGDDASGIVVFVPLTLLAGLVLVLGVPAFIIGIILVATSRKR